MQEERRLLKHRLFSLIGKEDRASKLRCKSTWAREGDAYTKIFHRLLSVRRTRNSISKLESDDGIALEDEEKCSKIIVEFYMKLYESSRGAFNGIEGLEWNPISRRAAEELEKPFEEGENKRVVFSCDGNKAPGPDGFTVSFFQEC